MKWDAEQRGALIIEGVNGTSGWRENLLTGHIFPSWVVSSKNLAFMNEIVASHEMDTNNMRKKVLWSDSTKTGLNGLIQLTGLIT